MQSPVVLKRQSSTTWLSVPTSVEPNSTSLPPLGSAATLAGNLRTSRRARSNGQELQSGRGGHPTASLRGRSWKHNRATHPRAKASASLGTEP